MKRVINLTVLLFICGILHSQIYSPVYPTTYGNNFLRVKAFDVLHVPESSTTALNTTDLTAQIRSITGHLWFYNSTTSTWLDVSSLASSQLNPTAVKTSNYIANANDFVPCDNTLGSFTVTLPNTPADKSLVAIKMIIQSSTNNITFSTQGADVINKSGGVTSGTIKLLSQGVLLQYNLSTHIWYILSDDLPLSQLDLRYAPIGVVGSVTSVTSADGNATVTNTTTTPVVTIVSAPKLQTGRTINGTSFDGTGNITVTAAGSTLTGTYLKLIIYLINSFYFCI